MPSEIEKFHHMDCGIAGGMPHPASAHCTSQRFGGGDLSCQRGNGHDGKHGSATPWGGWVTW